MESPESTITGWRSPTGAEIEVETQTHWGVRYPWGVRWNPTYGRGPGYENYYTEADAQAEADANDGVVVTRTVTITQMTTEWVEA